MALLLAIFCHSSFAQQVKSYKFAERDTMSLWLDVYQGAESERKDICVLYTFGGGFVGGSTKLPHNVRFFSEMAARGYTVVAISYRLGLKGVKKVNFISPKPVFKAVQMATEDLIAATSFVLTNADELRIDPRRIVLMGSSAGAITSLQADYELANRTQMVRELPEDFRYSGVVALAGAVFSTHGAVKYANPPAPTMMYHGTKDKIVVYGKIRMFNLGVYGTKSLTKIFDKKNYPYMTLRYKGQRHELATFPRFYCQDQICDFIDAAAAGKYTNELDLLVKDRQAPRHE